MTRRIRSGRMILLSAVLALAACANPPRSGEVVWVSVADIYTPVELNRSFNRPLSGRFESEGFTGKDIKAGRLLRVSCALGTDYTWGSYAYLPAGMTVKKGEVLRLRISQPGTDDRMGMNPVLGAVEHFRWPGVLQAYRYIPDWKERNLALNFERIPLDSGQQGRYEISHGSYVIRCRQDRSE
ncbi:MAG: hypothetical protein AB7E73_02125 [Burkholderiales bacterium]